MALRISAEQRKIADSICDSVYQKLLDANATKETFLQTAKEAGIDSNSGEPYLVGKLLMKIVDDFLITEKCDFQTFCRVLEMLKEYKGIIEAEYEDFENGPSTCGCRNMNDFVRLHAVNEVMNKIMQENSRFKELFEVVKEEYAN
jgi:hypothetical protein